jgi:hypothetical protein
VTRPLRKLASLLVRANRIASVRGKKSELARFLGVPRQRINDWLSGVRAPGGEVTLQLLEWVQAGEAKPKEALAVLSAPPEPKTQVRKSKHEKQTQVRKKR